MIVDLRDFKNRVLQIGPIALIILAVPLIVGSCDHLFGPDRDERDLSQQYLTATVNGVVMQADPQRIICFHPQYGDTTRFFLSTPFPPIGDPLRSLSISSYAFSGARTYDLKAIHRGTYTYSANPVFLEFITTDRDTGTVTITELDRTKMRVAGTFAFTARDPATDSVVTISNGSFLALFSDDRD
jgi:hypothetical protein